MTQRVHAPTAVAPVAGFTLLFPLALSLLSGTLIGAAMPTILDWGMLGWIGVTPLLVALHTQPLQRHFIIALPFGIVWSAMAHLWYPAMFGPVAGIALIVAVGCFSARLIERRFRNDCRSRSRRRVRLSAHAFPVHRVRDRRMADRIAGKEPVALPACPADPHCNRLPRSQFSGHAGE